MLGMELEPIPWVRWVRELQAIGQAGLLHTENPFDRLRYEKVARIAAEMAGAVGGLPSEAVAEAFAASAGDPTPKVDVRGAVFDERGRVLMVRERADGGWTLPGGWADPGEPPAAAVAREVREEAGYAVRATRLVAAQDRDLRNPPPIAFSVYKLFFLCERTMRGPVADHDHEIDAVDWFEPADPPPLSRGRVSPDQLALVARHHADPGLAAEFD